MNQRSYKTMRAGLALVAAVLSSAPAIAQKTPAYAFKNMQVHFADGSVQKGTSVVWRDGVIESVGTTVPFDAFVVADGGDSLHVYPGFIDGAANWGAPEWPRDLKRPPRMGEPPYDRAGIQPDRVPSTVLKFESAWMDKAQKAGFTQFSASLEGKMMPGQVEAFFVTGSDPRLALAKASFGLRVQFSAADVYPSTLMGMIVKIRQLFNEASALKDHQNLYKASPNTVSMPPNDPVLEALFPVLDKKMPVYFQVDSKEDIERVLKLKNEIGFDLVLVSAREAWMMKSELAKQKIPVLASINVADRPKFLPDPKDTSKTKKPAKPETLTAEEEAFRKRQENAWNDELANIKELIKAGVKTGYASAGLKVDDFRKKMELLLAAGYEEKDLVSLMTKNTAEILGLANVSGDLKKGFQANLFVTTKPVTDSKSSVRHHVAGGELKTIREESTGPAMPRGRRPSEDK